jgi:hypothetical protein
MLEEVTGAAVVAIGTVADTAAVGAGVDLVLE